MHAKIYSPAKTAMQSGKAKTQYWVLEFEAEKARFTDPLMGWTGSDDMLQQVRIKFESKEEAEEYAKRENLTYTLVEPKERKRPVRAYADNFTRQPTNY